MKMNVLFWKYDFLRFVTYWLWWGAILTVVGVVAYVSPKSALAMIKIVEPISELVKYVIWLALPDDLQLFREAGRLIGKAFRKVTTAASERTQVAIHMAFLNGFLFVTLGAHVGRWATMGFVKKYLIRNFIESHDPRQKILF